jgi:uncharacterized protein YdhG (YjbR/CyaY superfamily)
MAQSKAKTVEQYLAALPADRRRALAAVRQVILKNLPEGYEESLQSGMISYVIPLEKYPNTYNGQALAIASLASQKNHLSLYLMSIYSDKHTGDWFTKEYGESGKKLDMGKSCIRFKKVDDLPLELIGQAVGLTSVDEFISLYERVPRKA